ncbi:YgaP family membrane protein [Nocardioides aurantiacus]|uniref:YgaP family membrane protein n=1 Tax=Nocardioides aurantiacus TaxID=86796 RepID=UPI0024829825|nr:DUF2892 domain-containing protein [Nocardioides aurantiacus]
MPLRRPRRAGRAGVGRHRPTGPSCPGGRHDRLGVRRRPRQPGRQTWELERQVRLVAGSAVAASVLGSTVSPRLKWIAAAIGSGLTVAAMTNTCAMGMALSAMPWNRGAQEVDIADVLGAWG